MINNPFSIKKNSIILNKLTCQYIFKNNRAFITLLIFFSPIVSNSFAATDSLHGIVVDSKYHEPLPYINVYIKGTSIGTTTSFEGEFNLKYEFSFHDTIIFSYVGYKTIEVLYNSIIDKDTLIINMEKENVSLNEIEVCPNNSYSRSIIKKVIKNRKNNNPDNINTIHYKEYLRKSIFLSNLNLSITNSKKFRNNADAFIIQTDSTVAMPVFINEQNIKIIRTEGKDKETILNSESECIMPQMQETINSLTLQKITTDINFYNNQINILERGFPSPIAWNNQFFYNIYLVDSLIQNEKKLYRFDFFPKSYRNIAFKGFFWIDSETYALTEIYVKLPNSANINFVNNFEAHIYYQLIAGERWFYRGQKTKMNLMISKNKTNKKQKKSVLVQYISDYYHVNTFNIDSTNQHINSIDNSQTIGQLENNYKRTPFDSLEIMAYNGIKQLKNNRTIKSISRFSDMTLN